MSLSLNQIAFLGFAAMSLLTAILVLTSKKPIYSVIYLILYMATIAGYFLLLHAEFLFIVQLIVYAGAILVLFLYVVMLMDLNSAGEPPPSNLMRGGSILLGGVMALGLVLGIAKHAEGTPSGITESVAYPVTQVGKVASLGFDLFNNYLIPFEVVSILFLSAMVGAVMLGRKD